MKFIDISKLNREFELLSKQWNDPSKPFKYLVTENFLIESVANKVLAEYPSTKDGKWDSTTYLHQKNKYSKTKFDEKSILDEVFKELNGEEFLDYIIRLTGINELHGDPSLFGGGLHQSINGAFLDVHVDYNFHPETHHHRRLNVIIYLNKNWEDDYGGQLELWDMSQKKLLEKISPDFNRMVMFETNEVSFHGHPKPISTPHGLSRKSLAVYYYSPTRPENEIAGDHNTIYVNTQGTKGKLKTIKSGFKALFERLKK